MKQRKIVITTLQMGDVYLESIGPSSLCFVYIWKFFLSTKDALEYN